MGFDRSPRRSADLLAQLHADLERHRQEVIEGWREREHGRLIWRPGPAKWSAVDCVEHIRKASAMYLRQLDLAVEKAQTKGRRAEEWFRPGLVGERMRAGIAPREMAEDGRARIALKMPTLRSYDPAKLGSPPNPVEVLARFSDQLERFRALAETLEGIDLNARSHALFGPLMPLKIGDLVRYLVAHTDRHLVQAERAFAAAPAG